MLITLVEKLWKNLDEVASALGGSGLRPLSSWTNNESVKNECRATVA